MNAIGAGLLLSVSSILVMAMIASCLSKKPRDDIDAASSRIPAKVPEPATARAPGVADPVAGVPSSRPAPKVSDTSVAPADPPAGARANADALFEDERWLEAGDAYMAALAAFPRHPDAEGLLERALEAYEWVESEKQLGVLEEIFRRFPEQRTPAHAFDHAILVGVHVDAVTGIPLAEAILKELPEDTFRVYALRRIAGLHRAAGDLRRQAHFLEESRALASKLGDERTVLEIDRILGKPQ